MTNAFRVQDQGHSFGGFQTKLMKAIAHADMGNLARLYKGFPELVADWLEYAFSPADAERTIETFQRGDQK